MLSFLDESAQKILQQHTIEELKNIVIVLPSKRAGLHFKTALSNLTAKTFWAPKIVTLDDFILDFHTASPVNSIAVHFELYACYQRVFDEPGSFENFHNWSSQILNDFNEIDRYLIDNKEIFKSLKNIKEIDAWSFNNEVLSPGQEKFLEFWENLGELYTLFNSHLQNKNLSTKGRIYRDIASSPEKFLNNLSYQKVYVLGLNALSKSEEIILTYLKNIGKVEIFWDADPYYLQNHDHEAGNFIRKHAEKSEINQLSAYIETQKNITIYPANSNIDQIAISGQILGENFNQSKNALILADELMLTPLLNSFPTGVENMNITMGFPISNTLTAELTTIIFDLQINTKRFLSRQRKNAIYYKDFFLFLQNPVILEYVKTFEINVQELITKITKFNISYIPKNELSATFEKTPEIIKILFYNQDSEVTNLLSNIIQFFSRVHSQLLPKDFDKIEIEALYKTIHNFKLVHQFNKQYPVIESVEGIKKLFFVVNKNEKLSFYGEPLQGLQIMGLLETRAIDFENLIVLSCNEKSLPGTNSQNSFIPQDLKEYYGLPTKHDRESIYAYYFYRILQRSTNIHLIYNNGLPNELDSNEISRYLIQIEKELPYPIKIKHYNFEWKNKSQHIQITKNKETITKIDFLFEKGLSPSALNTYLRCPLDFYYKYVLRIREKDELEETIENNTQGDIIHKVLEDLYKEKGPIINLKEIDWMLGKFRELTEDAYQDVFPSNSFKHGKNLLYYNLALQSIELFLNKEKEFIKAHGPIEIIGLETKIETTIEVPTEFGIKKVLLKGKADRIDKHHGKIRIIDYKSGYTSQDQVSSSFDNITKSYKAIQLLFYAYLYNKQNIGIIPQSGIISMKNINAGLLNFTLKQGRSSAELSQESLDEFEKILKELIADIYDNSTSFSHNLDSKYCMMCD